MIYKKSVKYIAMLVLVAFTITFGLPTQLIADALQNKGVKETQKVLNEKDYEKVMPETELGSFTDKLYTLYEQLKKDIDSGDLNKLKTDIKNIRKAISDIRKNIKSELDKNEKTLIRACLTAALSNFYCKNY